MDQAITLLGMPEAISADITSLKAASRGSDHAQAVLRYPGRRVTLHISQTTCDHSLRLAAHGTLASFVKHGLDPQEDQSKAGTHPGDPSWGMDTRNGILTRADGSQFVVPTERGDYPAYYRAVAAALSGQGPMPATAEQALRVMEVIDAGLASSTQRREIDLGTA